MIDKKKSGYAKYVIWNMLAPVSDSKHEDNKSMAMGFLNEAEL